MLASTRAFTRQGAVLRKSTARAVVYWSIKSSFDLARYALGQTNEFQGTGVFNSIKFSRQDDSTSAADSKEDSVTMISKKAKGNVEDKTTPRK